MGGPDVVTVNDLYDLKTVFLNIGACLVAAIECKESGSKFSAYHKKKAKQWEKAALAIKKKLIKGGCTKKEFKQILLNHFKEEIYHDIDFLSGIGFKVATHHIEKTLYPDLMEQELVKWLSDDNYFKNTEMGKHD
jgi:hypothetical protein